MVLFRLLSSAFRLSRFFRLNSADVAIRIALRISMPYVDLLSLLEKRAGSPESGAVTHACGMEPVRELPDETIQIQTKRVR